MNDAVISSLITGVLAVIYHLIDKSKTKRRYIAEVKEVEAKVENAKANTTKTLAESAAILNNDYKELATAVMTELRTLQESNEVLRQDFASLKKDYEAQGKELQVARTEITKLNAKIDSLEKELKEANSRIMKKDERDD